MNRRRVLSALAAATALTAPFVVWTTAAGASPSQVWVSPNPTGSGGGTSCASAGYSSIQDGVENVAWGGTVTVCSGVYQESVTVDRTVTLVGQGATVDAPYGAPYGIGVSASWTTVRGMTVENAAPLDTGAVPPLPADGIVTIGFGPGGPVAANHVTIENNNVLGNLGSGIDLNSTSYSVARNNTANGNGVGINVADDIGLPATYNQVLDNQTNGNFGGCGIALADHTGAGVIGNLVSGNTSNDNGLGTPSAPFASAGSGVILASPIPGGVVADNTIEYNSFLNNGHGGVVVHSHAPTSGFGGNVVNGNWIGPNNLRTDEGDTKTTGIYLGSASPLTIQVTNNTIRSNEVGIFTAGPVTVRGINTNRFIADSRHVQRVPYF